MTQSAALDGGAKSNVLNAEFLDINDLSVLGFKKLGRNVKIHSTVVLVSCDAMSIGDDVRIDPFSILSAGAGITIGSNVHIAAHCVLAGVEPIALENFVGISHGTRVLSSTDDFGAGYLTGPTIPSEYKNVQSAEVRCGRHSVVGANCVVLPGAQLGRGAMVGALSLVKGELLDWVVAAGVPARPIGTRDREGVLLRERQYLAARAAER